MSATRLVLLGTAGGPLPSPRRAGVAQAIVVAGRVYLVDCGSGVTRQLRRARLLKDLHEVFITHLHSDHDCDYFNLFLQGWPILQWNPPVRVHGPGPAGELPPIPTDLPAGHRIPVIVPANPTPGLADITRAQIEAHAYDINIRMREAGRADLTALVVPEEIALPPALAAGPARVAPEMDPLVVSEDEHVRVTAVLVEHPPVFPAFAFRFETDDGSIVISGDTAPCANLVALAHGADILVHAVLDDGAGTPDEDESWEARQRERHLVEAHTTVSAAGRVAAEAGARKLVLTHFIPGEDELPDEHWIRGAAGGFDGEVIVGRDLLELVP